MTGALAPNLCYFHMCSERMEYNQGLQAPGPFVYSKNPTSYSGKNDNELFGRQAAASVQLENIS